MAYNHDPAWKYWWQKEGDESYILCKFCDHEMKREEESKFKFHLITMFNSPDKMVQTCPNVPPEVKKEILDRLLIGISEKRRNEVIRWNLASSSQHFVDDNDDDDEEDLDMSSDDVDLEDEATCVDKPVPKEFGCQKRQQVK
ncbi:Zinc finger, BED-type [Trema orientale]|uniref:Zinc finger, BED-type n=1 Tax=Trema orientale TaxID=63057 RepID=A0A2P5BLW4_TREOI|nr:Zinc finger, BED-type [Trema orientale]